jgi:uncharacterized membrane protein
VLCCFNSEFTRKINKITYKTDKNTNILVILLVLFVILLILFLYALLKQQITKLPPMKAVILHEHLNHVLDKIKILIFTLKSVVFTLISVVFPLKQTPLSVETTLAEALFLCRTECQNDTPVFTV